MQRNMRTLQRYLEERKSLGLSQSSLNQDIQTMRHLDAFLKKPFEQATKQDMIRFLNHLLDRMKASTIHNHKMRVKKFYQWLFKCEYRSYPEAVRWMRTNNPRSTKAKGLEIAIRPEDLLTDEDVLKMINAADHPRDQALVAFMYETGAEAIETLKLRVASIKFDEYGAIVSLAGTGATRRLRIVDSVPYLLAWLNIHPERKKREASLWMRITNRNHQPEGIVHQTLHQILHGNSRLSFFGTNCLKSVQAFSLN